MSSLHKTIRIEVSQLLGEASKVVLGDGFLFRKYLEDIVYL